MSAFCRQCGEPRVWDTDGQGQPVEDVHACPHGEEPCGDCLRCESRLVDDAHRERALVALVDFVAELGIPVDDAALELYVTRLFAALGLSHSEPTFAFADLYESAKRLNDKRDGVCEPCTDAELDLAYQDMLDALWACLRGASAVPCQDCRLSSLPVREWAMSGVCTRHSRKPWCLAGDAALTEEFLGAQGGNRT